MDVDPWGQRRDPGSWAQISLTDLQNNFFHNLAATGQPYTTRGFTGHEMVDEVGIIHMNGRIYDPRLARFLQADPFIQDPTDTQSLNRYAYVRNNPLNATDPSGFFLDHLLSFALDQVIHHVIFKPVYKVLAQNPTLAQFVQIVGTAVSAYFCGPCSIGFNAQFSANVAYAQSGDLKAALRASAIAGASSAAFYGVGQYLSSVAPGNFAGTNLSPAGYASKIALHGIIGGVMSELQGGKFGHGFAAAGVTAAASGLMPIADGGGPTAEGTIIAALVGGTASVISGGKFANGAVTAAFASIVAETASSRSQQGLSDGEGGDGTVNPEFKEKLDALNERIKGMDNFKTKDGALQWLHENAHPLSVDYDIEVAANVFEDFDRWRVGNVVTDFDAHLISRNTILQSRAPSRGWNWRANWHSHADGASSGFSGMDARLFEGLNSNRRPPLSFHVSVFNGESHELLNY